VLNISAPVMARHRAALRRPDLFWPSRHHSDRLAGLLTPFHLQAHGLRELPDIHFLSL